MTRKKYVDLGFACVDTDRQKRRGFPEVVFCQRKTKQEIFRIAEELSKEKDAPLLLTRLKAPFYRYLKKRIPGLKYNEKAKLAYRPAKHAQHAHRYAGEVLIVTAGTSDIPVAEEAALTLELMGSGVRKLYDVGVAGVHRILDKKEVLEKASCIIVVAGMEGALASLVSGLVKSPVIAVPTSCGYGASFGGLSALLTMLNSCSPGIAVINIDNGFGAGYFAGLVNRLKT
ncbi:MAG: nickel pincer cofactor biosynthesis protein LarB [Candidatus Omnitrophota bacterium]